MSDARITSAPASAPASEARAAFLMRRVFLASFFSEIPPTSLGWITERLAGAATSMRVPAGTVLYRRGEPTDWHYFIVEGAVRLEADDAPSWTFDAPALVGTFDLLAQRVRSRTAVATSDVVALRVASEDWLEMLEDGFESTRMVLHGFSAGISILHVELGASPPPAAEVAIVAPASGPPLGFYDRIVLIEAIDAFATDDAQALANLAAIAEEQVFAAGEAVSVRGVADERITVVVAGRVEGTRAEGALGETYGAGSLVFGVSALGANAGAFEAIAAEPTRVLRIEREDYFDLLEEHFGLARAAMKALTLERERLVNEEERRKAAPVEG